MLYEIYFPESSQTSEYDFGDPNEILLLQIFVWNEVLVGLLILIQFIYGMLCTPLTKSDHIAEIEGVDWGINIEEIEKVQKELAESRMRTES